MILDAPQQRKRAQENGCGAEVGRMEVFFQTAEAALGTGPLPTGPVPVH